MRVGDHEAHALEAAAHEVPQERGPESRVLRRPGEPRRRGGRALVAVVQDAYVHGASTRKVDDLMRALGLEGISRSEESRVCGAFDAEVEAFRTRPITGEHPYLRIDATYHKVRQDGRVQSMATVVAIGVTADGERQVLGVDASSDGK